MVEQSKAYCDVSQNFAHAVAQAGTAQARETPGDEGFKFPHEESTGSSPPAEAMFAAWQRVLEVWGEGLRSLNPAPTGALSGAPFMLQAEGMSGVADGMYGTIREVLSGQKIDSLRDWQKPLEEGVKRWSEYQRALGKYHGVFGSLPLQALEHMRERVLALGEEGQEITSLRQLYGLWAESGETAYLALVSTDEYAEIFTDLLNALIAVKQHAQQSACEIARACGLPSHRELDAVHQRLHALRRELKALQAERATAVGSADASPSKPAKKKRVAEHPSKRSPLGARARKK